MVTFAQAQERAEEWINGDVVAYQHREVRVREFELGFVVWAEDRVDGPRSDGGAQRLVIARDSGEATLWPSLLVGEVIRRYEEQYGVQDAAPETAPAPAARVDLNQTSFLLSPPEWLQEAADKLGIPDRRTGAPGAPSGGPSDGAGSRAAAVAAGAGSGSVPNGSSGAGAHSTSSPVDAPPADAPPAHFVPGAPSVPGGGPAWPAAGGAQGAGAPGVPADATPWAGTDTNADAGDDRSVPLPATVFAPPLTDVGDPGTPPPNARTALMSGGSQLPRTAAAPAVDNPHSPQGPGAPRSETPPVAPSYGYPQGPGGPPGTPPPGAPSYGYPQGPGQGGVPGTPPVQGGSQSVPPSGAPAYGFPQGPGGAPRTPPPGAPPVPGAPGTPPAAPSLPHNASDIADAATSKAQPPRGARGPASAPPPPSAPGVPGARPGSAPPSSGPGAPGTPAGGYVPTQLVSQLGSDGPEGGRGPAGAGAPGAPAGPGAPGQPGAPGGPNAPGGVHHAATMLSGPPVRGPGASQPPGAPGAPSAPGAPGAPNPPGGTPPGAVHHAATMLSGPPVGGPGAPPPPHAPGMPPGAPQSLPGQPRPGQPLPGQPLPGQPLAGQPLPGQPGNSGQQPPAYGYPQTGQPTVGPGYQAVLRYRAQDGSEQQLIRRSAPGTPHPEWQMLHELRAMNVPPQQVLELHTELESCELPGAYCARMIRETWPQARITSIAPYGTDHASRQQGMGQLLAHQGELHQVADGPARPAPVRAPIPPVQPAPPLPPEAIGQELAAAFGPGVFRFDQVAVSRQGVPNIVAHTLVVAGLPVDMGPFFWAQAQPGRPVPTLAELAMERGVQPASDAGSYLVMGSDFGKAICVQYGTANIVAVPVEAGPGGGSVPPQFVNTGLPEFGRCLALLGRMWRLRFGLNQEQAGRWTVDFQAQLASLDPAALGSPESWWSVLLEQMWDGLL
ncbi:SUKH-4 family immunity protein [Streptomyces sp. NPDC093544]|uniref:SUKH-4 family immunity protein n=1 Tax=Streptomyces sp. NPDC093544 TaxID=3155200 RepID=UPI003429CA7C